MEESWEQTESEVTEVIEENNVATKGLFGESIPAKNTDSILLSKLDDLFQFVYNKIDKNDKTFLGEERQEIKNQVESLTKNKDLTFQESKVVFAIYGALGCRSTSVSKKPRRQKQEPQFDHAKWRNEILGSNKSKQNSKKHSKPGKVTRSFF